MSQGAFAFQRFTQCHLCEGEFGRSLRDAVFQAVFGFCKAPDGQVLRNDGLPVAHHHPDKNRHRQKCHEKQHSRLPQRRGVDVPSGLPHHDEREGPSPQGMQSIRQQQDGVLCPSAALAQSDQAQHSGDHFTDQ